MWRAVPSTASCPPALVVMSRACALPCCEPLDEPCPAGTPGTAEVEEFLRRLAQRYWPVMRAKGLALNNHAVVEQDMQHIEQRQLCAAPRPSPSSEGTADFAFERPRVACDSDLVEEAFHFPLHRAKTGR